MKKYKRYEGLFLAPNMCDGIYDTYNDPNYDHELSSEQIIDIMNDKNNEIQVWKKKYDDMKKKNEFLMAVINGDKVIKR